MKNVIISLLTISMIITLFSCKKEKTEPDDGSSNFEIRTFNAKAFDTWVYFSFEKGEEVEITDFKNSTEWDIGFHRFDVRLNCGTSGKGMGGSINMGKIDFNSLKEAPADGYSLNDSIEIVNKEGDWTNPATVPGDTVLAKWLYFTGPPPRYNITDNIFVVKTAAGKYVKVWLKDYYNDNSESGYIKMQYFYQKDGSRNLDSN